MEGRIRPNFESLSYSTVSYSTVFEYCFFLFFIIWVLFFFI